MARRLARGRGGGPPGPRRLPRCRRRSVRRPGGPRRGGAVCRFGPPARPGRRLQHAGARPGGVRRPGPGPRLRQPWSQRDRRPRLDGPRRRRRQPGRFRGTGRPAGGRPPRRPRLPPRRRRPPRHRRAAASMPSSSSSTTAAGGSSRSFPRPGFRRSGSSCCSARRPPPTWPRWRRPTAFRRSGWTSRPTSGRRSRRPWPAGGVRVLVVPTGDRTANVDRHRAGLGRRRRRLHQVLRLTRR